MKLHIENNLELIQGKSYSQTLTDFLTLEKLVECSVNEQMLRGKITSHTCCNGLPTLQIGFGSSHMWVAQKHSVTGTRIGIVYFDI